MLGSRRNAQIRALLVTNFAFLGVGVGLGSASAEFFFAAGECVYPRKMQSRCSRRALVAAFLPLSAASLDAVCSLSKHQQQLLRCSFVDQCTPRRGANERGAVNAELLQDDRQGFRSHVRFELCARERQGTHRKV